ncbi:hypothetical protein HPB51_014589 [Rhipicephalus microplus]|uniref:C3H1-type domain-containing protein n=1 Tax=Rhipicephalus microplus TaxID=6941 RepID=A0A9J6F413_RHIMP|nr:hypothetical protein HPB51_014589 [Rhipicephalus microplus]
MGEAPKAAAAAGVAPSSDRAALGPVAPPAAVVATPPSPPSPTAAAAAVVQPPASSLVLAAPSSLVAAKDSRWLQLEVCREYQRNKCSRQDAECKFAHPPPNVEVQNGRVIACYDSIKVSQRKRIAARVSLRARGYVFRRAVCHRVGRGGGCYSGRATPFFLRPPLACLVLLAQSLFFGSAGRQALFVFRETPVRQQPLADQRHLDPRLPTPALPCATSNRPWELGKEDVRSLRAPRYGDGSFVSKENNGGTPSPHDHLRRRLNGRVLRTSRILE